MAKRLVDTDLWNDPKITDHFTPEDKYFWLFLLTTRFGNLSGCFEVSIKQIANDMGYSEESIKSLIKRFEETHELILYSKETNELVILNFWKYNWTRSDRFHIALTRFILEIKNESFRNMLLEIQKLYRNNDTLSIPYRYLSIVQKNTISNSNTNTIPNTITNTITKYNSNNSTNGVFKKPTVEEIRKYCESRKNNVIPEVFYDFYQSKGWKIGKNKMKDWKASVRTWERNITNNELEKESEVKDDGKFNRIDNR